MLHARGLTKRFAGREVLADVSLDLHPGEVVGVLGENGAGKSTLVRILCGELRPDAGTMTWGDAPFAPASARAAAAAGIGVVRQHFALVPGFSAAENLALALHLPFRIAHRELERAARELADYFGLPLPDLTTPAAALPVGVQQRIEILKALARPTRVLLLDEPTAVLAPPEVDAFLAVVRALRSRGIACVLIDHKLPEVLAVADRLLVLRQGRMVLAAPASAVTPAELTRAIVGQDVASPLRVPGSARGPQTVLALDAVDAPAPGVALRAVSLVLHPGEVLGIAGVDGNGQQELCELLVGLRPVQGGALRVDGQPVRPRGRLPGAAVIPPDRHQALALSLPVAENLALDRALLPAGPGLDLLPRRALAERAARAVATHRLRTPPGDGPVRLLSGGNQQKLVVARALESGARWLVAVSPTRGLDVGAAARVHEELLRFVTQGGALVLISADLDEVLALSDRVQVLLRGRLSPGFAAPFPAASRAAIGHAMTGGGGA